MVHGHLEKFSIPENHILRNWQLSEVNAMIDHDHREHNLFDHGHDGGSVFLFSKKFYVTASLLVRWPKGMQKFSKKQEIAARLCPPAHVKCSWWWNSISSKSYDSMRSRTKYEWLLADCATVSTSAEYNPALSNGICRKWSSTKFLNF